jgi:hypothetical protein
LDEERQKLRQCLRKARGQVAELADALAAAPWYQDEGLNRTRLKEMRDALTAMMDTLDGISDPALQAPTRADT